MTSSATDDTNGVGLQEDSDRYAELSIGDEEFVIYDRENHQAWIQSTVALPADELQ